MKTYGDYLSGLATTGANSSNYREYSEVSETHFKRLVQVMNAASDLEGVLSLVEHHLYLPADIETVRRFYKALEPFADKFVDPYGVDDDEAEKQR